MPASGYSDEVTASTPSSYEAIGSAAFAGTEAPWFAEKDTAFAFADDVTPVPEVSTIIPAIIAGLTLFVLHMMRANRRVVEFHRVTTR